MDIRKKLNSSLFVYGNISDPRLGYSKPESINKPFFTFNTFNIRSTASPFSIGHPIDLNGSEFQLFSSIEGLPYKSFSIKDMEGTPSVHTNNSFVSLDDAWWLPENESSNFTTLSHNITQSGALSEVISIVVISTILGIMILTTVIGNVFVIAAILLERNLQQVANFLIVSLAVADLMVACLVMPLGAVYVISNEWILGPELCDMWTSCDVLCCTASILHLVAIALDRYWAVTRVDYIHSRNGKRIGIMIFLVWMTGLAVSVAPLFGWKDADFHFRVNEQKRCIVSQDIAYQIFATMATFYVPLTAILVLYWKIFQTARKRIHKRSGKNELAQQMLAKVSSSNRRRKTLRQNLKTNGIPLEETTQFTTEGSGTLGIQGDERPILPENPAILPENVTNFPDKSSNNGAVVSVSSQVSEISKVETVHPVETTVGTDCLPREVPKKTKKEILEAKREKKAAKTLAIITGAFVVCWMPFFVTILVMSICPSCWMSELMFSIFLWLGYFNSTLNPIIYTIFSPEFRQAFKRILCGKQNQRYRPGKI